VTHRIAFALVVASLAAGTAQAQSSSVDGSRAGRAGAPQEGGVRRQRLEQQLREGLWRIAKRRIGFSDEQMKRLEETSQRYDARRRALIAEERAQRLTLRQQILTDASAGGGADQDLVARALDRILQLHRDRIELEVQEQKEFAAFMTPIQRAKYVALQEEVRRRADALRRQRPDSTRGINRR
jgi:protein CpxP